MIADLDAILAEDGTDIVFRQIHKAPTPHVDTPIKGHVRDVDSSENGNGVAVARSVVIISPTGLPAIPKRLDQILVDGKVRTVQLPRVKRVQGQVVRIELDCEGVPG
ncbi:MULTISPECIES: hypothetical protein [unclassified Chelatococcus]|uniref:hypothetical protein n=1 Tax=unclassified Chelatococcus TaxID=2638111 RepID=UPI001BCC5269|nr:MULTISPECIES: hypothetical protein [unclassified Chelatococcus]MBS7696266.1 hypothetical protein [Chelatococcus sp. YT9]MBX3560059.1 hypothetical protein [Chelatococcus sp.]